MGSMRNGSFSRVLRTHEAEGPLSPDCFSRPLIGRILKGSPYLASIAREPSDCQIELALAVSSLLKRGHLGT
jgi:hypothetical protein